MNGYWHIAHGAFIVGNGRWDFVGDTAKRSNAFEVSNDGHAIVYDNLGRIPDSVEHVSTRPVVVGARYVDNTTLAWGYFDEVTGKANDGFGILTSNWDAANQEYRIVLDYHDPHTGVQTRLKGASIVATLVYQNGGGTYGNCLTILSKPVTWSGTHNEVRIVIVNPASSCQRATHEFMFQVVGRPQ